MTEFDDRIEGEIKTHEAEMLRKAVIAKYASKPLYERIVYILERFNKPEWTVQEIFEKLNDTGIAADSTLEDVVQTVSDPDNKFNAKISRP